MAISDSAKVDLLYKKLFGVAKTDTPTNKSPSNEAIASPALLRGDNVWQQATSIPAVAAAVTSIVQAYQTTNRIECTADTTSTPVSSVYPSWKTNLTDWIPPEFGSTYFVKVYAELTGNANPTVGTPLSDSGIAGVGEWNFDYQSGVLNFIGGTIPAALTASKVVYVTGYRYIGLKGVTTFGNVTFGNITVSGNISGNIVGNVLTTNQPFITSLGNLTSLNVIGNLSAGNLIVGNVDLSGLTSNVITANAANIFGNAVARWFLGNVQGPTGNFTTSVTSTMFYGNITAQSITSPTGDLHISAATNNPNNIIRFDSVSAFDIPSGNTAQRPPSPDYGYVRYNTESGTIEWWGGTSWVSGAQTIQTETINPDGVSLTYTLNQGTTETGILVNVNGTIQQAGSGAYTVAGDQITFGEAPLATDIIEIRYLASGVAALATNFGNIASNVVPSANVTYSLGTTTNRWKDLWLSGSTIYLGDATLSSSNGAIQLPAGSTVGGANVDITAINSNIATVNANVVAANAAIITANTGMKSYVDQGVTTIQANLGAYQLYANANAVAQETKISNIVTTANANTSAYLPSYLGNIGAVVTTGAQPYVTTLDSLTSFGSAVGSTTAQGNLTVIGNLTVQGNTITIGSNNLTVTDSIIDLHTPANLQPLISDDGRDIGFRFHYYKGSDDHAFFGLENQTETLVYLQRSDEVNSNITGTYGNVQVGSLHLSNTTPSTSNVTGALVVRGGVGVSGNLNANGAVKLGQPGTASNVVIAGTTTAASTTTGALVVRGGVGVAGGVYAGTVTATTVSASSVSTYTYILNNTGVTVQSFVGREVQDNTITTTDVDLSGYFPVSSSNYCYVTIQVTGQYIANIAAPATQARLLKSWSAGIFKVDSTGFFTIEGEVLQHAAFNTDATNFPAGAVAAGKAFLTGSGTGTVALRFTNRTTPAATSATYWSYKVEVQTV